MKKKIILVFFIIASGLIMANLSTQVKAMARRTSSQAPVYITKPDNSDLEVNTEKLDFSDWKDEYKDWSDEYDPNL